MTTLATAHAEGLSGVPFARPCEFRRGAFLVEADCPADRVYFLREGQVRCYSLSEDGCEATTAILGPSQLVGVAGLLGLKSHVQFAEALVPVRAWALPVARLLDELPRYPGLRGLVVGALAQRFALAEALLRDVLLLPVSDRVQDVQLRLSNTLGGEPPALTRAQLACLVQARPETLARVHPVSGTAAIVQRVQAEDRPEPSIRDFRAGNSLGEVEPPAGHVIQVIAGYIQVALAGPDGREVALNTRGPGDFLGISALVGLPPTGLRAVARTDGAVRTICAAQLLVDIANQPTVLKRIVEQLGQGLLDVERQLSGAATRTVRQRLLARLRELRAAAEAVPGTGPLVVSERVSHAWLARQIGSSRETVTRVLGVLENDGVIAREGRRVMPKGVQAPGSNNRTPRDDRSHHTALREDGSTQPTDHRPEATAAAVSPSAMVALVPIELIDEPLRELNARGAYPDASVVELAASLRQDGVLQPVCIRPEGQRFRLVYGMRRLLAARQAGLTEVPCTIRILDDDRAFLMNLVENLHRQQLSGPDRVRAIERLAATGLGVRGIARRTGFDPSTISRWLRIGASAELRAAVEDERLDITRAKILVRAPEAALPVLLARAPSLSIDELRDVVAAGRDELHAHATLQKALHLLRSIAETDDWALLVELRAEVDRLAVVAEAGSRVTSAAV